MKIIVAIDRSIYWKQVIDAVVQRTWQPGTVFKILTVIEPMQWEHFNFVEVQKASREISRRRQQVAEETLAEAKSLLEKRLPACSVTTAIKHGNARAEIMGEAVQWTADKIIVGAHGLSSSRLLPGTISRAVARHAPCSVELIRLAEPVRHMPAVKRGEQVVRA